MGMKNQMVERKKIQQEEEDTNWVILSRYFVLFGIKNWTEEWKINFGHFYCSTLAVFKNLVLPNFLYSRVSSGWVQMKQKKKQDKTYF